jgi:hypothetical protein
LKIALYENGNIKNYIGKFIRDRWGNLFDFAGDILDSNRAVYELTLEVSETCNNLVFEGSTGEN